MKYDKTIQPAAMFMAYVFIYIQLLYYCRYVITIGYWSHCLSAEYIWKFKSKCSSYCEMVCEKIHYLSKELVFFIHHILLYLQKILSQKKPHQTKKKTKENVFLFVKHRANSGTLYPGRQFRYSTSWPARSNHSCLEKPFCFLK